MSTDSGSFLAEFWLAVAKNGNVRCGAAYVGDHGICGADEM